MRPGIYDDNKNRSYPLIRLPGVPAVDQSILIDCQFDFAAYAGFVPGVSTVWLSRISSDGTNVTLRFSTDAEELSSISLDFVIPRSGPEFQHAFASADATFPDSTPCAAQLAWFGFVIVCNRQAVVDATGGGPVTFTKTQTPVEPVLVRTMEDSYVRSVSVANQRRTLITDTADTVPPYLVYDTCLQGPIKIAEGHNCVLPDTVVQGSVLAASRVWYTGTVSEIVTRAGRRRTVTPHHPVMTTRGFVAAGQLQVGENLIAYQAQVDSPVLCPTAGNHKQYEPTSIKNVFEAIALRDSDTRCVELVRCGPDDLHGDGVRCQGQIEIVRTNRHLTLELPPCNRQEGQDLQLSRLDLQPTCENRSCPCGLDGVTVSHTSPRDVRGRDVPPPLLTAHPGIPYAQCFGGASHFDPVLLEAALKAATTAANFISQRYQSFPLQISLDDIVEIRNREYSGHVFDLQTTTGMMVAEGLYISNCRITVDPEGNALKFGGAVGAGLGPVCEEIPASPAETAPDGSELLSGGPGCNEVVKRINGLTGPTIGLRGIQGFDVKRHPSITSRLLVTLDPDVLPRPT